MAKLVIIEDEDILRELMASELTKVGYTVFTASNGQNGWGLIRKVKPDLILLDLLMPMLSGYEVLEHLRRDKTLKNTPCIVVSNSGQIDDLDRAKDLGADDVLIKADFNPSQVVEKVMRLVGTNTKEV